MEPSINAQRPSGLSTPVVVALTTCALVATGAWLGADWLRTHVLGLPMGLWVVLGAMGVAWLRHNGPNAMPMRFWRFEPISSHVVLPAWLHQPVLPWIGPMLAWIAERVFTQSRMSRFPKLADVEQRLNAWHDAVAWPERRIRVGLDLPSRQKHAMRSLAGLSHIEWVDVQAGTDDARDCDRYDLDAIVREPATGPTRVSTRVRPDHDAAWYDWALPRPLTYAAVFPARVDPERVTLADVDFDRAQDAVLVARVLDAAATLARAPGRLTLADRFRGRRPVQLSDDRLTQAMDALADALQSEDAARHVLIRGISRVIGAHYCADAADAENDERLDAVDAACSVLPDEPESVLRLAAARLGVLDDEGALDAIVQADRMLRTDTSRIGMDHLAFLQSEVEHGLPGSLTLGRVAAGICLVCASVPAERFDLVEEDILDDLRFSGWLIGRDNDRAVLIEVFRRLRRERTGKLPLAA